MTLKDKYGRSMGKLRISLTDRCNMRCMYCMPENPEWMPKEQILTLEEIFQIAKIFVDDFGISEVRLTGGEPLLRNGITELIKWFSNIKNDGLKRISMTSNGLLLKKFVSQLKESGLDDLNISLDSLNEKTFFDMTKGGDLKVVLDGINESKRVGFRIKINTVLVKGFNDCDINNLVEWALNEKFELRFIEFMPIGGIGTWTKEQVVSMDEILNIVSKNHRVECIQNNVEEPARRFIVDGKLKMGIIATVTNPFCHHCNRIRLGSDGKIYPCLFATYGIDIKQSIRSGQIEIIKDIIKDAWINKQEGFISIKDDYINTTPMHILGG